MRIAMLGNLGSVHVSRLAQEMVDRGFEVVLIGPQASESVPSAIRFDPNDHKRLFGSTRAAGRALAELLRDIGADVLQVHYAGGLSFAAANSGFHPFVLTVWGSDVLLQGEKTRRTKMRLKQALTTADVVTCHTQTVYDAAVDCGAPVDRIVRVGWGVQTEKFRPDSTARQQMRASLGISAGAPVIVSTRYLRELYRVDVIVRAMRSVLDAQPEAHLLVAGDGSEKASLEHLATELGIAERVHFLGALPSVNHALAASDVYVSVPRSDGGPQSGLEAKATGLALVVSDLPANREQVVPDANGRIWDGESPESLAAEIIRVLGSDLTEIGRLNRQEIIDHEERSAEMEKLADLYRGLAAGRSDCVSGATA